MTTMMASAGTNRIMGVPTLTLQQNAAGRARAGGLIKLSYANLMAAV